MGIYGKDEDFFTLKGMVVTLLERLGIEDLEFAAESDYKVYHPGRCARILTRDKNGETVELGIMGEVHPDVAENYGIGTRCYICELFFDLIVELFGQRNSVSSAAEIPFYIARCCNDCRRGSAGGRHGKGH